MVNKVNVPDVERTVCCDLRQDRMDQRQRLGRVCQLQMDLCEEYRGHCKQVVQVQVFRSRQTAQQVGEGRDGVARSVVDLCQSQQIVYTLYFETACVAHVNQAID